MRDDKKGIEFYCFYVVRDFFRAILGSMNLLRSPRISSSRRSSGAKEPLRINCRCLAVYLRIRPQLEEQFPGRIITFDPDTGEVFFVGTSRIELSERQAKEFPGRAFCSMTA